MPRTSRSVAQRLATQTKSKRRRPARPTAPETEAPVASPVTTEPTVEQILDEVVPSGAGPRAAATPSLAPVASGAVGRRGVAGRTGRAATLRRRYSEYAEEYEYIWADLRRIMVVAGVLIVLLVVLSFFIE
jgi:hypothetical protein